MVRLRSRSGSARTALCTTVLQISIRLSPETKQIASTLLRQAVEASESGEISATLIVRTEVGATTRRARASASKAFSATIATKRLSKAKRHPRTSSSKPTTRRRRLEHRPRRRRTPRAWLTRALLSWGRQYKSTTCPCRFSRGTRKQPFKLQRQRHYPTDNPLSTPNFHEQSQKVPSLLFSPCSLLPFQCFFSVCVLCDFYSILVKGAQITNHSRRTADCSTTATCSSLGRGPI